MLYIRADMNPVIATGHIMRCLSIADAAKKLGENVTFILADTQAEELVHRRGHQSIVLHSPWDRLELELGQMLSLIQKENIKILLVDSYYVTEHYLGELNKHTHVMYLDDKNAFHYPASSLLCYAAYYEKFHYQNQYRGTELLLGTKYAPLRAEFCDCAKKNIRAEIKNMMLMSGGTDEFHIIDRILEQTDRSKYDNIYAFCGIYYDDYEELIEKYKDDPSVKIVRGVSNIREYMEFVDVAISAAGSTLYELASVGTPAISYTFADNQIDNALWWDEKGMIAYAGDLRRDHVVESVLELLDTTYKKWNIRKSVSVQMQQHVDGKGAERIAQKMIEKIRGK